MVKGNFQQRLLMSYILIINPDNINRKYMQGEQEPKPVQEDHFPSRNTIEPLRNSITDSDSKAIQFKLVNFQDLDNHEKNVIIDNIAVILDQFAMQGILTLKTLLHKIIEDKTRISFKMLQKTPQILNYLQKYGNLEEQIKKSIIPFVIKFLNSEDIQTKEEAGRQLGLIASKLNEKDRGQYILKHVLLMSHDDNQNNRLVSVQLMSNLSECLGKTLCEQFIGLQFLSLGDDPSEIHLPIICKMVSPHFFQHKILPFFYQKAEDQSNWGIRKACADAIISIGEFAQQYQRQNELTTLMLKLTKDTNKWVKLSAYLNLGKFIYLLKGLTVHQKLFRRFLKMGEKQIICLSNQNQVPYSCAFNFPAVTCVMGSEKWPQMNKTYQKLLKINDKRIKKTLSASLHQIAKTIGGHHTQKYLFKIMDDFLKDQNDDIKLGVIENMSQIIFVLNDQKRETMISIYQEFQKNQQKWRIRKSIAKQLKKLLEMYSPEIIHLYILPILLGLCSDSVHAVRQEAAKTVYDFIDALKSKPDLYVGLIESFVAFASSPLHLHRLQFIKICEGLIKNRDIFEKYFKDTLFTLRKDKVINIRIALAQFVNRHMKKAQQMKEQIDQQTRRTIDSDSKIESSIQSKLQQLYQILKQDEDQDVRSIFMNTYTDTQ